MFHFYTFFLEQQHQQHIYFSLSLLFLFPSISTECNPPGYLYQPAEMNGHMMEYTTLSGSSQLNGNMHGHCMNSGSIMPQGCHYLHHKLPNGLTLLNGSGSVYSLGHSHTHDIPLPHSTVDFEHTHLHHVHSVSRWRPCLAVTSGQIMWIYMFTLYGLFI